MHRTLYVEGSWIYSSPPYREGAEHVAAFVARFRAETAAEGFALVAAERSGRMVGFAHGVSCGPDGWWRDADQEPEEIRGLATFAVLEFIVTRAERGKGIGTALMTALLADRPERYATLCANPAAPARRIYQRWGWRSVATVHPPTMGAMDVLLFEFHPDRGPAPTAHP